MAKDSSYTFNNIRNVGGYIMVTLEEIKALDSKVKFIRPNDEIIGTH